MGALCASLALLLSSAGASAQVEGPYVPPSGAVDHVVTVVERTIRGPFGAPKRITHHSGWSRIERIADGGPRIEGFVGHAARVSVSLPQRTVPGLSDDTLMILRWHPERVGNRIEGAPAKTGERRVVLGEACEVWRSEPLPQEWRRGHARYSCLTADGIELAARVTGPYGGELSSSEAIGFERRPVDPDEAHPPSGLLSIASWVKPEFLPGGDRSGKDDPSNNHEVVLRGTIHHRTIRGQHPDGADGMQIRRRHGAWTYEEVSGTAVPTRLTVRNGEAGFGLSAFRAGPTGPDTLVLRMSRAPGQAVVGPPRANATPTGRFEDVLGEACEHFVVHAGPDGELHECRTPDGLTLKERSRFDLGGARSDLTATAIRRGGATLPSIISQSEMLDPARWGLPR